MSNPQMMQQMMGGASAEGGNPMQQLMSNPQMMQLRQQMGMDAPGGGMFGNFGGLPPLGGPTGLAPPGAVAPSEEMLRSQFASQLGQLVVMGFTNESRCLQVLQ